MRARAGSPGRRRRAYADTLGEQASADVAAGEGAPGALHDVVARAWPHVPPLRGSLRALLRVVLANRFASDGVFAAALAAYVENSLPSHPLF